MSDELPPIDVGDVMRWPGAPFTDAEIEAAIPLVPWRAPLLVAVPSLDLAGFACRFCIVQRGLRAVDVGALPQTREAFDAHMASEHP